MNVESNGMAAQALHQRLSILLSFKTRMLALKREWCLLLYLEMPAESTTFLTPLTSCARASAVALIRPVVKSPSMNTT
jgi:hypothetical protein